VRLGACQMVFKEDIGFEISNGRIGWFFNRTGSRFSQGQNFNFPGLDLVLVFLGFGSGFHKIWVSVLQRSGSGFSDFGFGFLRIRFGSQKVWIWISDSVFLGFGSGFGFQRSGSGF
jgi:hypothetical protein